MHRRPPNIKWELSFLCWTQKIKRARPKSWWSPLTSILGKKVNGFQSTVRLPTFSKMYFVLCYGLISYEVWGIHRLVHSAYSFFSKHLFSKAHRSFLRLQVTHTPTHLRVGLHYSLDCTIVWASQNRQECKLSFLISKPHANPLLRSDSRDSLVRDARQVKKPSGGSHFWSVVVFVWQIDHILYTCKAKTAEE